MPKRIGWLLACALWFTCPNWAKADITETLNTPLASTPATPGLATAVFHAVAVAYPNSAAVVLTQVQGFSTLPYYAFQDVGLNTQLTSNNEFTYYTDSSYTTASFFRSDAAGDVLPDISLWNNSGIDFVGYINFPLAGSYTITINWADDALGIFLNGNGTPGSGDFVAANSYTGDFYVGNPGVSPLATVTVNTAGWYPFEMANYQGCCGDGFDVTVTGPATVQFASDTNHWTAFVPPTPLPGSPLASYVAPAGLAAAVWHNVTDYGASEASIDQRIAYANSVPPNYVFLDMADTNFFAYAQLYYNVNSTPYTVGGFVINGNTGLAISDTASLDFTMIDFVGWMYISVAGTYYFRLGCDDTGILLFGGMGPVGSGTEWIRTTYTGAETYHTITTGAQVGWYPIEVLWNQGGGGGVSFNLIYSGPGNIHLAADANRWIGSVSGLSPSSPATPATTSWVPGFAAVVYHLANTYEAGATLDATILPPLMSTMQSTVPSYRFFTAPMGNTNALNYHGNEAQATSSVLGPYAQGSATSDATAVGSTLIDHQGWVYFDTAGYQWLFFDAATDFGAIYLGGNGTPGTGNLLLSGSFDDAPGAGAWGRVYIATPGWYPLEVLWLSRYDCGAACIADFTLSAWGPGNINFAAMPVSEATSPAATGLLATVYRLASPLPIGTDAYNISTQLSVLGALQPNYTFLDPMTSASFNLSGTDSTPLNTFLGAHASGLAAGDSNAIGATIIDFKGTVAFSQAGNYTFALTAADDAAVLLLGQEPNAPLGQIVLERNFSGTVTSVGALSSPLTLQVNAPTSHPFELVYYNSGDPASTNNAALALSVSGPAPVTFAAPLDAPTGVSVCGDFNAYIPATTATVDVANYGAIPNDGTDDYAAIQMAVAALTSNQTLLFHPGNYNILYSDLGTIATLSGKSNIEIDGNGATFLISGYDIDVAATSGAFFKFVNSDHITIHDLSIDMPRPPYSFGQMTSAATASAIHLAFDPLPLVDAGMQIAAITEYDTNGLPLAQGLDDYYYDDPSKFSVSQDNPQHLLITMNARSDPGAQTGEYVMVRHAFREQPAFWAINSNYISIGNVNVYAAPGDGVQANMVNTLYIQNLNLRNGPGRHMSVTGHGIEAHGSTGGVTVCGASLEGMGGDGIFTAGQPGSVTAVSGTSLTVSTNANYGAAPFRVGDIVRVFSPTGSLRSGGVLTPASSIDDTQTSNTLAFQFLPSGTTVGDTVTAYNRDTNITIRYSAITHNSGRGIALANGGVIVDHTQIQGSTGYGVHCYGDLQTTAPACDRVLISNNTIQGVGNSGTLASASFQSYCNNALCPNQLTKTISLLNNAIDTTAGHAVEFAGVYGFTMKNNVLNKVASGQPINTLSAVDIQNGTLGVIQNNSVQNSSVLPVSQSSDTNVTISNNTGTW